MFTLICDDDDDDDNDDTDDNDRSVGTSIVKNGALYVNDDNIGEPKMVDNCCLADGDTYDDDWCSIANDSFFLLFRILFKCNLLSSAFSFFFKFNSICLCFACFPVSGV